MYGNIIPHLLSEDDHSEILEHISSYESYDYTEKVEDEKLIFRYRLCVCVCV